jgi:ribosomal protein S12 methylthiotransferase accessory factor
MQFDPEKGLIGEIDIELTLPPEFPDKYRGAIVNAMQLCTVKKHLHDPPEFKVTAVAGETAVAAG